MSSNEELPLSRRILINTTTSILQFFLEGGWLVNFDQFIPTPTENVRDSSISIICIPTKNRIEELKRCIHSFSENQSQFNKETSFLISDDSPHSLDDKTLSQLKTKQNLFYCGFEEKNSYLKKISAYGISEELLKFALFGFEDIGPTYGGNRNAILLHTVGELGFSADDDTICKITKSPGSKTGIQFGYYDNYVRSDAYADRESLLKSITEEKIDVLSPHNKFLGKSFNRIIFENKNEAPELDFSNTPNEMMFAADAGDSNVALSFNGTFGDSGIGNPQRAFFLSKEERIKILIDKETFERTLFSREIVKTCPKTTILSSDTMMAGFYGFDNRDWLPPFYPNFGAEDDFFAFLVRTFCRSAYQCYLPWNLFHTPLEKRENTNTIAPMNSRVTISDFIKSIITEINISTFDGDQKSRINYLCQTLKIISVESSDKFIDRLRRISSENLLKNIDRFYEVLGKYPNSPKFWIESLKTMIKIQESLISDNLSSVIPEEVLFKYRDEKIAIRKMQEMVSKYSELLINWDKILKAAKELKEMGIKIGKPI